MKKRNAWKWFTGAIVSAALTVFLAVPPQVAGPIGTAINDQAWGYFDDGNEKGSPEGQQAAEKRLLLDERRQDSQGQNEDPDSALWLRQEAGEQGRESFIEETAKAVLMDQVTSSLDKSR